MELSDVLAAPVVCVVRQVRWRALAAPVVCVVWQVRWQALRESLLLAAPVVCVVRQVRWQALQKALVLQGLGSALDPPLQALQALQFQAPRRASAEEAACLVASVQAAA